VSLARELIAHLLIATMVIATLIGAGRGVKHRTRFVHQLATEPGRRIRFYRVLIVRSWVGVAVAVLVALLSTDLSRAGLGWTWPNGDGLDYVFAGALLITMSIGALRMRSQLRRGHAVPGRDGTIPILPRTPAERRWAVGVALTAGITEEAVFRGLLIAVGTQLYGLPLAVAVAASLALFVAGHTYQGGRGMVGVAVLGGLFTMVYLMSGSLLLAIVLHVGQDLLALLLIPAHPSAPRARNDDAAVAVAEVTGRDRPAAPVPVPSESRVMPVRIRPPQPGA
jgi:membrane protease YdiL (CAAX protease family)